MICFFQRQGWNSSKYDILELFSKFSVCMLVVGTIWSVLHTENIKKKCRCTPPPPLCRRRFQLYLMCLDFSPNFIYLLLAAITKLIPLAELKHSSSFQISKYTRSAFISKCKRSKDLIHLIKESR